MADQPVDIQFDSYDLQNDTIITSQIDGDDSAPKKEIGIYEMPVIHGAKQTFEKYAARRITIQGVLKSTSASGLVGLAEELKEVASRRDKTLQITYPGTYNRIYTASVEGAPEISRSPWAVNIADFKMTFIATQPFSTQTTATISGVQTISGSVSRFNVTISGTVDPQPLLSFHTTASGSYFSIFNETTNDVIGVTTTFSGTGGRDLRIDANAFSVLLDGAVQNFSGKFPNFVPGVNTLTVTTVGNAGASLDQYAQTESLATYQWKFGGATYFAQSFVPTLTRLLAIEMYSAWNYGEAQNITVYIYSDSAGSPGSLLGTATINAFTSASPSWRRATFPAVITVTPGTTYWIVVKGGSISYQYTWFGFPSSQYSSGQMKVSYNSGLAWSAPTGSIDLAFRTYGDLNSPLTGRFVIEYNPRRW